MKSDVEVCPVASLGYRLCFINSLLDIFRIAELHSLSVGLILKMDMGILR